MYLSIIILPLLNFVFCGLYGRFVGRKGVLQLSVILLIISFIISLYKLILNIKLNDVYYITIINWLDNGLLYVDWGFMFDILTLSMLTMISFISLMVHIYSGGYMQSDPYLIRFISYLSLFTFLMFILISSDNLIQLFLGWEGVGLCSYLLISFWNTRIQANKSAIKALIMNRIGDFGLLLGISLIYYFFRTIDFTILFSIIILYEQSFIILIGTKLILLSTISFCLFIGCCGKSAQLLLHTWLPDAMEGPTPVSALIHAATMVTAGIFLIIRCSILFELASNTLTLITFIGTLTAFFASTIGLLQYDIKKVIAYSTCSQLGYMIAICGISQYTTSIFHLINHAFFKALLFLTAGTIIHSLSGEQDIRKMGSLIKILPFAYVSLLFGSLALCGIPFYSGYYSKDTILELMFINWNFNSTFSYWLGSIAAMFTALYSYRLLFIIFFSNTNEYFYYLKKIHELSISLSIVLFNLFIGSVYLGYIFKDLFINFGNFYWQNSIFIKPFNFINYDIESINTLIKNIPTFLTLLGFLIGYKIYNQINHWYNIKSYKIINFFNNKWYFDYIYNIYIGYYIYNITYYHLYIVVDKGILEVISSYKMNSIISNLSFFFKKNQNGLLFNYQAIFLLYIIWISYFFLIFI